MKQLKLQILKSSYWEHFKFAKDLALVLPIESPERKRIEEEVNRLQLEIQKLEFKH